MSLSFLSLLVIQCFMFAAIYVLWIRLHRAPADDPRLTKGLQLLQSKIAVLEDLSDRTETQVNQLTALMENKIREIQTKIIDADRMVNAIEMKIQKSMEVAKIFQDKIPHKEILDRQFTIKYVKAAKLAHQGLSCEEISRQVDLTLAEIELILKLNKEQLMFSENDLPEWISDQGETIPRQEDRSSQWIDFEKAFEVPRVDQANLKRLGDQFKEALASAEVKPSVIETKSTISETKQAATEEKTPAVMKPASTEVGAIKNKLINFGAELMGTADKNTEAFNQKGKAVSVKPFEFKRIESRNDMGI